MITQFHTPVGRAGSDQVDAMEGSVNAHLEQMFLQRAKQDLLLFGVDRTTMKDSVRRLDAQKRECEGQIVFHAGRALELSMQVVYARGSDRIIGREYPGIDKKTSNKDRKSHDLHALYSRIIHDLDVSDLNRALEVKYQEARHRGILSIYSGGQTLGDIWSQDQRAFTEKTTGVGTFVDGEEHTMDHSTVSDLFVRPDGASDFSKMPERTFQQFLKKADSVYYKGDVVEQGRRRNMRWGGYSARDHEIGRPYVVIGVYFFARLVQGIIALSGEPWTWHEDYLRRAAERNRHSAMKRMESLSKWILESEVAWSEGAISNEEVMEQLRYRASDLVAIGEGEYGRLHAKLDLNPPDLDVESDSDPSDS